MKIIDGQIGKVKSHFEWCNCGSSKPPVKTTTTTVKKP